jgi:hypothetical protein
LFLLICHIDRADVTLGFAAAASEMPESETA